MLLSENRVVKTVANMQLFSDYPVKGLNDLQLYYTSYINRTRSHDPRNTVRRKQTHPHVIESTVSCSIWYGLYGEVRTHMRTLMTIASQNGVGQLYCNKTQYLGM